MSDDSPDNLDFAARRAMAASREFFGDGEGAATGHFNWLEHDAELDDPDQHIPFDPVPRRRRRRRGWSEARQRAFIFALSRCGSVARAARAVGMSPRSAYQLVESPGADSFASAWDQAVDEGVERMRSDAFARAIGGAYVPVYRRGKIVRVEHRQCDALAIALLSGRDKAIDDYRHNFMTRRRKLKADFAELDRRKEEERCREARAEAEYQALVDHIELKRLLAPKPVPRIKSL